jgi:hypothetical protein
VYNPLQKFMALIVFENYKLTAHATSVLNNLYTVLVYDSTDRKL